MRKAVRLLVASSLVLFPGTLIAGERLDGAWMTTLTCPAKGNTEGYTWKIPSVIENSNFRAEHGVAGQPGYLIIEGPIKKDGSAKLTANGTVGAKEYARGVFVREGADYSYDVNAQFKDTTGTGTKGQGLGIVGRTCTFDFVKQQ